VTALLFDLDGTLIDSAPDIAAAVNKALAEQGAAPLPLAVVRGFIGHGVPALIDQVIAGQTLPLTRDAMIADFLRHYAASTELTTLYPHVRAALAALGGRPLALCTNKPESAARAILRGFDLDHLFGAVIGGDSLPQRKPHPAPIFAAMAALNRDRAIFVGDSEVDAETARAAGVPFLLFTQGYRKAAIADIPHHASFDDFAALPALIAGMI
jgi:phosphoglycolate phosphatase